MQTVFIQNHWKLSITEEKQNMTKYLSWNTIRFKFVKKTGIPNPVKTLGYIKCYSSSRTRPMKTLAILLVTTARRLEDDREHLKPYWNQKKAIYLLVINKLVICKDFTNSIKKANRVVVCSCRSFTNILKYRDISVNCWYQHKSLNASQIKMLQRSND